MYKVVFLCVVLLHSVNQVFFLHILPVLQVHQNNSQLFRILLNSITTHETTYEIT